MLQYIVEPFIDVVFDAIVGAIGFHQLRPIPLRKLPQDAKLDVTPRGHLAEARIKGIKGRRKEKQHVVIIGKHNRTYYVWRIVDGANVPSLERSQLVPLAQLSATPTAVEPFEHSSPKSGTEQGAAIANSLSSTLYADPRTLYAGSHRAITYTGSQLKAGDATLIQQKLIALHTR
ncbi:MAG: hypothetical protein SPF30_06050 [Arcanobacterium sp.]|nr:hypothetical protein [Arcanobacterium sp.]